jgi:hypothetical protein
VIRLAAMGSLEASQVFAARACQINENTRAHHEAPSAAEPQPNNAFNRSRETPPSLVLPAFSRGRKEVRVRAIKGICANTENLNAWWYEGRILRRRSGCALSDFRS